MYKKDVLLLYLWITKYILRNDDTCSIYGFRVYCTYLFLKLRMSWKELNMNVPKHDIYLPPDENQCTIHITSMMHVHMAVALNNSLKGYCTVTKPNFFNGHKNLIQNVWALTGFTIFGCLVVKKIENKVSACFFEIIINSENPSSHSLPKLVPSFR